MLAALALADYNVLDEWRKKMGGTVKSTVDPMTGHVSSLHRASSGTGWGGYEDGWDEELEARAAGLVANVFSDMPLTELARDTKRRPELAQLMKAWFDPDPAEVALCPLGCMAARRAGRRRTQCRQKCVEMGME